MYLIEFTKEATRQVLQFRKSSPQIYKKIEAIIYELRVHPYTGTGHPEQLKYLQGIWSRKLDKKNRILYTIKEEIVTVYVISVEGHYNDK